MIRKILFIFLLFSGIISYSQTISNRELNSKPELIFDNVVFKTLDLPVLLFSSSLITYSASENLHNIRSAYTPNFSYHYDDYLQYAPAAAMYIMKLAGVSSRSRWGNMLVADAFSVGITTSLVNGIKYSVKRLRPDKSASNSFPSGHTATAFLTASLFHKEYGHISPWLSATAYTCASTVGLTRVLNNRHYVSDVLAGAGIGILSAELGYLISDAIMKPKGRAGDDFTFEGNQYKPSFVGIRQEYSQFLGDYNYGTSDLTINAGAFVGVEGAWYLHKNWGLGAQLGLSTADYQVKNNTIYTIGHLGFALGPSYSLGLGSRFYFDTKFMCGMEIPNQENISPDFKLENKLSAIFGCGINYLSRENFGFKIYTEYKNIPNFVSSQTAHIISLGITASFMIP